MEPLLFKLNEFLHLLLSRYIFYSIHYLLLRMCTSIYLLKDSGATTTPQIRADDAVDSPGKDDDWTYQH